MNALKHSPRRLLQVKPIRFVADVVQVYFAKRVGRAAGELAYFLILTFFPIIICVSAFLERLHLDFSSLLAEADYFLPDSVLGIFQDYLRYLETQDATAMFVTGLFLAVCFASAAMRGLMNIMQELFDRATFRGVGQLVASVVFSLMLLLTIYLSLAVVVTGNWFFHRLGQMLHLTDLAAQFGTWQWVKYVLLLSLVFLFILLLYRFAAPLSKPRPAVVPGALAASVALAVSSVISSFFMSNSTQYSLIYGSLASVIILLVWLYLCGNILILGNVVNYVLYCHKKGQAV